MKALENRTNFRRAGCALAVLTCALSGWNAIGQEPEKDSAASLSMEQLVNMNVSSVERREQKLYKTSAAVFVVTRDDIRRSGADNVPELLRMVPGIEVAQVQASRWAVSARGFNGLFANKMLVLIDGRSIYNLDWSGTYWDMNELPLDTIDRIEVIRGPGATMWGANAVNGVINIITLKAQKTIGTTISAAGGTLARSSEARYGASVATGLALRTFARYQLQSALVNADGSSANDGGRAMRAGMRLDWQPNTGDTVSLDGDIFRGKEDQQEIGTDSLIQDKVSDNGGFARGRWEHRMSGSDTALQVYYEDQNRWERLAAARFGSVDVDFQDHISSIARNDLMWGLGTRLDHDHGRGPNHMLLHREHTVMLYSSFLQDDFSIVPDKLVLTVGSKFDWNTYTHFEIQPSVRLLWTPDSEHSIWTAVSRPVRTPSFRDRDMNGFLSIPSEYPIPVFVNLEGNAAFKSEDTIAYEAGYRQKLQRHLSVDIAGYFAHYTRLETDLQQDPYTVYSPVMEEIVPTLFTNLGNAKTQGIEASMVWNPVTPYHLNAAYSWQQAQVGVSNPAAIIDADWATPRNTISVRNSVDLTRRLSFDSALYAVAGIPGVENVSNGAPVHAYQRIDGSVGYSLPGSISLRVGGRNLQSPRHFELNPDDFYINQSAIPRSIFANLDWKF